jgi:hypothetical protein
MAGSACLWSLATRTRNLSIKLVSYATEATGSYNMTHSICHIIRPCGLYHNSISFRLSLFEASMRHWYRRRMDEADMFLYGTYYRTYRDMP